MVADRVVFSSLFCKNPPGEGNLLSIGVALSCSKAKEWSVPSPSHLFSRFLWFAPAFL